MKTRIISCAAGAVLALEASAFGQQISLESAPPVVVKTVPVAGSTEVDPSLREIRVTYSKAMQDGSWSWSTWGEENYPETTGQPKHLADARTCVLPVKLQPGKFYAIWLNSDKFKNFTDASGRSAVPYLLTFRTSEINGGGDGAGGLDAKIAQLARAGTEAAEVIRVLGEPKQYLWGNETFQKDNLPATYVMRYPGGVHVTVGNGHVSELRSEPPGPGFTFHGRLRLGSSLDEVLQVVGQPTETVVGKKLEFQPGVLYKDIEGKKGDCYYARPEQNFRCFFADNRISALYLPLGEGMDSRTAKASANMTEREVNRLVNGFPEAPDLSTPEAACAAWQRANASKDAKAISQLSLVPLDPKAQENWYQREAKRDPEGLAVYLKALAESKILVVQIWRGELANVITYLPFPPGKGRQPYSARRFGLANGTWRNLGEDRLPELETAKSGFVKNKDRLWQQFAELKSRFTASNPTDKPSSVAETAQDSRLSDDQRAVLAWTDRQFRSFFDARTFAGWSDQERADLETRSIDALKGPRSQEYYQAINTLAALRSTKALSALRAVAYERVDRNNRDRWMAIRALGLIGDKADVPELIHLVYHGNVNTHWWAQISLVRITGQNFAKDWNAWGKWWNDQKAEPPYKPEIIRWWNGQPEPDKLAASLEESDLKFLASLNPK